MNVQLFIPCFIDQLFPQTAFNMVKLLEKAGCTVTYNTNQTCCGQPAFNAGFREESKMVCSKFIKDFPGKDYVVVPSASCVGFVKNYYNTMFTDDSSFRYELKALQSRIFELSDFLVTVLKITDFNARFPVKATYHDSCAALRECKLKHEPRVLLEKVSGLQLKEMEDVETCCGFGGTFAVKFDAISSAMADQKINHATATEAEYIISTDISCLMHIGSYGEKNGSNIKTMHLADVLVQGW
jgi:L-lactate dehydrogenase complex protein LldE